MGPLNSGAGRQRIAGLVDEAVEQDEGRVLTGGCIPEGQAYAAGHFYAPTVVTGVAPGSRLLREEVFGPVLPAATFADLDEAIALANDTPYGLGASVWTRDPGTAREVTERLEAGIVWVNLHLKVPPEVPFGGVEESGLGRENGIQALEAWSEEKTVLVPDLSRANAFGIACVGAAPNSTSPTRKKECFADPFLNGFSAREPTRTNPRGSILDPHGRTDPGGAPVPPQSSRNISDRYRLMAIRHHAGGMHGRSFRFGPREHCLRLSHL